MAKENYEERMLRETFRREATIHSSVRINLIYKFAVVDLKMIVFYINLIFFVKLYFIL